MANKLAVKHGRIDARTFAQENPDEIDSAIKPGQLGADEALINALGVDKTAALFGLTRGGTRAFSLACADYNRAFDATLAKLARK